MSVEIKAGQRWCHKFSLSAGVVLYVDKVSVLLGYSDSRRLISPSELTGAYDLMPAPKTRYITEADLMKMLAEYGVIYSRVKGEGCGKWMIAHVPEYLHKDLDGLEISPNPFAPNPVIVGPEIEVVE